MRKALLCGCVIFLVYVVIPVVIFQFISGWGPTQELNLGHYYIAFLTFFTPVVMFAGLVMWLIGR